MNTQKRFPKSTSAFARVTPSANVKHHWAFFALVTVIGFWLPFVGAEAEDAARIAPPLQTEVEFNVPKRPSFKGVASCAEVLNEDRAYYAYLNALEAAHDGAVGSDIPFYDCLIAPENWPVGTEATIRALATEVHLPNILLGYLNRNFEHSIEKVIEEGQARGGHLAWPGAYLGEAALIAYQRTSDRRFFELYARYFERVLELSDPQLGFVDLYHGRIMNAWGEAMHLRVGRETDARRWVAHVTHFGRIMAPALGFAEIAMANPEEFAAYEEWAVDTLRFFESGFQHFEADRRIVGEGNLAWYWRPLDDHYEPINHITSLGRALLPASRMTDSELYRLRIREILEVFTLSATLHDDKTLSWPYSPFFQTPTARRDRINKNFSEYTWKGSITLPFVYEAKRSGFTMQPEIEAGIRNTVLDFILADSVWKRNVHPHKITELKTDDIDRLMASVGGYHVAFQDDSEVVNSVLEMMKANPDMYPRGFLSHTGLARSYALFLRSPD